MMNRQIEETIGDFRVRFIALNEKITSTGKLTSEDSAELESLKKVAHGIRVHPDHVAPEVGFLMPPTQVAWDKFRGAVSNYDVLLRGKVEQTFTRGGETVKIEVPAIEITHTRDMILKQGADVIGLLDDCVEAVESRVQKAIADLEAQLKSLDTAMNDVLLRSLITAWAEVRRREVIDNLAPVLLDAIWTVCRIEKHELQSFNLENVYPEWERRRATKKGKAA